MLEYCDLVTRSFLHGPRRHWCRELVLPDGVRVTITTGQVRVSSLALPVVPPLSQVSALAIALLRSQVPSAFTYT
jgi:hypothetical protein